MAVTSPPEWPLPVLATVTMFVLDSMGAGEAKRKSRTASAPNRANCSIASPDETWLPIMLRSNLQKVLGGGPATLWQTSGLRDQDSRGSPQSLESILSVGLGPEGS